MSQERDPRPDLYHSAVGLLHCAGASRVVDGQRRWSNRRAKSPTNLDFNAFLCLNTPYRDFLKVHVKEILETFPVDGLFLDIVMPMDCSCVRCRASMKAKGMDPSNKEARLAFAHELVNEFKMDMTRFIRQHNKKCTIFYNNGHVGTAHRQVAAAYAILNSRRCRAANGAICTFQQPCDTLAI